MFFGQSSNSANLFFLDFAFAYPIMSTLLRRSGLPSPAQGSRDPAGRKRAGQARRDPRWRAPINQKGIAGRDFNRIMKTSKKLTIMGLSAATALVAATGAVSSFAWFAVNSTVTAGSMVIKANSTDAFLEIKKGDGTTTWPTTGSATSVTVNNDAVKLSPTHVTSKATDESAKVTSFTDFTQGTEKHSWVYTVSNDADSYLGSGQTASYEYVTTTADKGNTYTLLTSFDLRLRYTESAKDKSYTLSAAITWDSETSALGALGDSARVLMVIGGTESDKVQGNGYVFNARKKGNDASGWNAKGSVEQKIAILNNFKANKSNQGTRVHLFYYFDGEDVACTTKNAAVDSSYSITATFSVAE